MGAYISPYWFDPPDQEPAISCPTPADILSKLLEKEVGNGRLR